MTREVSCRGVHPTVDRLGYGPRPPPSFGWRTLKRDPQWESTCTETRVSQESLRQQARGGNERGGRGHPPRPKRSGTHPLNWVSRWKTNSYRQRRIVRHFICVPTPTSQETRGKSQRRCKRELNENKCGSFNASETPDGRVWIEPLPSVLWLRRSRKLQMAGGGSNPCHQCVGCDAPELSRWQGLPATPSINATAVTLPNFPDGRGCLQPLPSMRRL